MLTVMKVSFIVSAFCSFYFAYIRLHVLNALDPFVSEAIIRTHNRFSSESGI